MDVKKKLRPQNSYYGMSMLCFCVINPVLKFYYTNYFNRCYSDDGENMSTLQVTFTHSFYSQTPPIKHVFYFTDAKMFTWHCYINIKMSLINT